MASRIKDTIGISLKEKGRKRLIKPLVKSTSTFFFFLQTSKLDYSHQILFHNQQGSEALEDKGDSFKCKKRPWSEEEDLLVIKLVKEHGPQKWTFIATHLEGRIGKQCRERWHNHLNPNIKKCSWSEEEEWVLYLFHKGIGNKWAEIAKYILGRTDNSIKNHWNSGMKKRLDDYGRKLANVREIFAEVGESYFDRVSLLGEKKALEILLLNKQYVPSDCDDDIDDDEEEDEQSQEENQNVANTSTNQSNNNTNTTLNNNTINNSLKEVTFKEDTDNSTKTKEKQSVSSKTQVNPFSWTKAEEECSEKNSSTVKKIQPIPQLLKHSQSLQPTQSTATAANSNKENCTFTPKANQINMLQQQQNTTISSYSSLLKENKNENNKSRAEKKSLRQLSPSLKEDPKKKLKLEEVSPTELKTDKARKNQSQKENINSLNSNQIESQQTSKVDATKLDGKTREYGQSKEMKQEQTKDNQYYNYCEDNNQQYSQIPNDDKSYPYPMYEGVQPGPYPAYHSSYHPYPLHRSQSLNGYIPPPPSQHMTQQCYSNMYPTPVNTSQNTSNTHFPHPSQTYNPYNHMQSYKYDPHYYSHYQGMNFMYYPSGHPNQPSSGYPQQPYPYYKDYQYPKGQQPPPSEQQQQYPKRQQPHSENASHPNRQSQYPAQISTQSYYSNDSTKNQQSVNEDNLKKQKLSLQKSVSMPSQPDSQYIQDYNSSYKNVNNEVKKQSRDSNEEQLNRSRVDTKSTIYSQQMQSTQQSKNNQKEYMMSMNFIQSEQRNNYFSNLNSDFKCKQIDSSPFQSKKESALSESLQSSEKQNEDELEPDNDQKIQRNFSNQMAFTGLNAFNSQMFNNQSLGINYESPSKMLNLSERVMLKTVSSNKHYMYNLNSNIKYPQNRQSINPLNLNSLFNQEDEFFNENSQLN